MAGASDVEVVGIAENIRHIGLNVEPQPTLFVCNLQAPSLFRYVDRKRAVSP